MTTTTKLQNLRCVVMVAQVVYDLSWLPELQMDAVDSWTEELDPPGIVLSHLLCCFSLLRLCQLTLDQRLGTSCRAHLIKFIT